MFHGERGKLMSLDGSLHNAHEACCRWVQDAQPPTDPREWGGAIGAWIFSPAQADLKVQTRNPKPPKPYKPCNLIPDPYTRYLKGPTPPCDAFLPPRQRAELRAAWNQKGFGL